MQSFKKIILITFLALPLLFPAKGFPFFSTFDTAELLKPDHYQLGLEPQYIINHTTGANVIAHLDMGAPDGGNLKFLMGAGTVTYQAGAFYKFVPFPDIEGQPGIGGFFGLIYSNQNGNTGLNFRFHPLISKKFTTDEHGEFTPYASIPIGISQIAGTTSYPIQLEVGTRWLPGSFKNTFVWAEVGIEVNAAFSYISAGLSVPFDTWDNINFN